MLDFYGLPTDFPQYNEKRDVNCYQRVAHLTDAFQQDIDHPKFLPYLTLHEFEALMFCDPAIIASAFPGTAKRNELEKIRATFDSPEEINLDDPPSKRLEKLFPEYQKTLHSYFVVDEIGLERIRQECRHFNQWLETLEKLGN